MNSKQKIKKGFELFLDLFGEAVYFNIGNRKDKEFKSENVPKGHGYMVFDQHPKFLNPPKEYKKIIKSLGFLESDCLAQINEYSYCETEKGSYEIYPLISGGKFNPIMKWKSSKTSARRRFKNLKRLSILLGKKVFIMNLNLTFPKEISYKIFNNSNGQSVVWKCYKNFLKKLKVSGIILPDKNEKEFWRKIQSPLKAVPKEERAKLKKELEAHYFKQLEFGHYANFHEWSSSNPFDPHAHIHNIFPNYLYDKDLEKFFRVQPQLTQEQLKRIKSLWLSVVSEAFPDATPDEINIWFQYKKGFTDEIQFPIKPQIPIMPVDLPTPQRMSMHHKIDKAKLEYKSNLKAWKKNQYAKSQVFNLLKYNNRSYLTDLAKYLSNTNKPLSKERKKNVLSFCNRGHIKNSTRTLGYLRNMKRLIKNSPRKSAVEQHFADRDTESNSKIRKKTTDLSIFTKVFVAISKKTKNISLGYLTPKEKPPDKHEKK